MATFYLPSAKLAWAYRPKMKLHPWILCSYENTVKIIMNSQCFEEGTLGGRELTLPFFAALSFRTSEGDGLYSVILIIQGPCKAVQCAKYVKSYILVPSLLSSRHAVVSHCKIMEIQMKR